MQKFVFTLGLPVLAALLGGIMNESLSFHM
jgi:hypothetical protein